VPSPRDIHLSLDGETEGVAFDRRSATSLPLPQSSVRLIRRTSPLHHQSDVRKGTPSKGLTHKQFELGDEVYARPDDFRIGTFAEFVAVKEASLALKPKGLTMEEAASIPLVALTAWQALVEKAKLKKGQKVFIQAGAWICRSTRLVINWVRSSTNACLSCAACASDFSDA
jgi:hypothetical protein